MIGYWIPNIENLRSTDKMMNDLHKSQRELHAASSILRSRLFFFSPSRSKAKTVHSSALFLVYRVLCVKPPSVLCATPLQHTGLARNKLPTSEGSRIRSVHKPPSLPFISRSLLYKSSPFSSVCRLEVVNLDHLKYIFRDLTTAEVNPDKVSSSSLDLESELRVMSPIALMLLYAFGDESPYRATVFRWLKESCSGRNSLQEEEHTGMPQSAKELNFGSAVRHKIIYKELHMKKVVCRWVPHNLTKHQKEEHVRISKETLKLLYDGDHRIISKIVTGDKTYVLFFDILTRQESKVRVFKDDPTPTMVKR
ncbi:uncharacterized protein TNCV_4497171 [Trichonephila clavipes]|nr:uncharacterized protein TNCV_4497171 [Trichonephila clavipes]